MNRTFTAILTMGLVVCLSQAAYAQISVRSALADDRYVAADSTYEGVIQVWNETDDIQEAKIYQTDYMFFADGSNRFDDPGTEQRSNASWARVSAERITLPPRDRVLVSYTVDVPDTVGGLPVTGSYWSMIMVEGVPKESPESTVDPATGKPRYSVLQLTRYGVQIATHIVGTGVSDLALPESKLVELEDGELAFKVVVENTGSEMVRPEIWVELYDERGQAQGRREGIQNRIYPGTSVSQQIRLGALPIGDYRALVILDSGPEQVFGAEYRLRVD